ncbi:hypothetical protein ABZ714_14260 [Streptomyces sp. NPDC006798]
MELAVIAFIVFCAYKMGHKDAYKKGFNDGVKKAKDYTLEVSIKEKKK